MIKLGDTVKLKKGFQTTTGICKSLMLVKWKDWDKSEHLYKYVVFGLIFADNGFSRGCTILKESNLKGCRKYIQKLIKDEEVIINA